MDSLVSALLTGTVLGAAVTGAITLVKPLIDYWVNSLNRRSTQKAERRALVEGVVERLRKLRVDHWQANHENRGISYDLVLEAADSALLIHDRGFAKYLSRDIENASGFGVLYRWHDENGEIEGYRTTAEAARAARWDHLKLLVSRASEFAVTGKWDKAWAREAEALETQIATADAALDRW